MRSMRCAIVRKRAVTDLRQMLHRDGERKIVTSEAERAAALVEGWGLHRTPPPTVETPAPSEAPPTPEPPAVEETSAPKKRGRKKKA
jgi:hypothetical protein